MKIVLALIMVLAAGTSFAKDGSSGCGPGWYVLKENSLLSSALRATTNSALAPVMTLGMTTGTSNCTKHKIVKKEKQSLHFVTMNYWELKREAAKGSGEHVDALALTIGCRAGAKSVFANELRRRYSKVFAKESTDPKSTLVEIYKTVLANPSLNQKCVQEIG